MSESLRRSNLLKLNIFVLGILLFVGISWTSHASPLDFSWKMIDCSYKIIYGKELGHWKLIEHGMTKDASHRSYEFETRNW